MLSAQAWAGRSARVQAGQFDLEPMLVAWAPSAVLVQAGRSEIPIAFDIPYGSRPSGETGPEGYAEWTLKVEVAMPGTDLLASFEVPVFETAESDPDFVPDYTLAAAAACTAPNAVLKKHCIKPQLS